MTCIVALREGNTIIMGADRSLDFGEGRTEVSSHPKIKKLNENMTIGISGSLYSAQTMLEYLEVPDFYSSSARVLHSNLDENHYMMRMFLPSYRKVLEERCCISEEDQKNQSCRINSLVICNGKIYDIGNYFEVIPANNNFMAAGSGQQYALGSLYSTKDINIPTKDKVRKALESAAYYNEYVREPFDFLEVECLNV